MLINTCSGYSLILPDYWLFSTIFFILGGWPPWTMSPSGQWEIPGGDQNVGGEILGYYSLPVTLSLWFYQWTYHQNHSYHWLALNQAPVIRLWYWDWILRINWFEQRVKRENALENRQRVEIKFWNYERKWVYRGQWEDHPDQNGHKLGGIETIVPDGLNRWRNVDCLWCMLEAARTSWWRDYLVQTSSVVTTNWLSWLLARFWLGNDNNCSGWKRRWFMCILTPLQI